MTRSEEELRVDKERQQTGKVRLRKYVVTEQQNIQVPVQKEVARVVREPATGRGGEIGDAEAEITLSEERAVVTKETVPKERVRLEKDVVQDTETVSGEVRKEQIEVEGDVEDTTTSGGRSEAVAGHPSTRHRLAQHRHHGSSDHPADHRGGDSSRGRR